MPQLRQSNGPYEKISEQDKQRLLEAYENDEDFVELVKILKIKRTTAYSIVKRGRATNLPRGGSGLYDIISSTAGDVTISKCQSWYNHTTTYLPACIGREKIDG